MNDPWQRIARAISAFVKNPAVNLVKGIVLLYIGVSEASRTFREDIMHGHVGVGHGILIIGVFSILDALPHVIDGLDASSVFLDRKGPARDSGRRGPTMSVTPPNAADPRVDLARRRTGMAAYRTRLAMDRTTLAWVRTSLAMASFGFGMVAFFRTIEQHTPSAEAIRLHRGAIRMGTALLLLGIAGAILAALRIGPRSACSDAATRRDWADGR